MFVHVTFFFFFYNNWNLIKKENYKGRDKSPNWSTEQALTKQKGPDLISKEPQNLFLSDHPTSSWEVRLAFLFTQAKDQRGWLEAKASKSASKWETLQGKFRTTPLMWSTQVLESLSIQIRSTPRFVAIWEAHAIASASA